MLNQDKVIQCAISTAAMDDLEAYTHRKFRPSQRGGLTYADPARSNGRTGLRIALCFSEGILDLGDRFFRPIEIDGRGKALLKKRQYIAKGVEHFDIDTTQSGILFCHVRRVRL